VQNPLVIAYHLIWTAYGWWLPNDPRGSGSDVIRTNILAELGELHEGRKKVQPTGKTVREFYEKAADMLKHPLLTFDDVCRGIIMPDHVHLVIRKHKHLAEDMVDNLKNLSRQRLIDAGMRALTHPTWTAGHGWSVFLDHPDDVRRTNRYVEKNPLKDDLAAQSWPFVKPYDNWPLHPGHSPNSPYARRLRALGRYP